MPLDGQREPDATPEPLGAARRGISISGIIAAVIGLGLFAWFIQSTGPAQIWAGLAAVGWGLVAIIAIAGTRFLLRATAWRLCLEPRYRLPLRSAFAAVLAGDALVNLIPLGLLASEPAKAAFVRRLVPLNASIPAIAIENLFYTLSVAGMIAASTIALILTVDLPDVLRHAAWIAIVAIGALFATAAWMLWRQPAFVSRVISAFVPKTSGLHGQIEHVRDLETQIYTFALRRRAVLLPVIAAELAFHALGVLEVSITLWLMQGEMPPLVKAFILEGANRLIVVLFKFVPLQLGIAELGNGSLTQILGYGVAAGVTLSIVRKVRIVFWVLVGTSLLVRRGFRKP